MDPQLQELNYIAIVFAAIAANVIGALWYSKLMFANAWLPLVGKTEEEVSGEPSVVPFVVSIASSILLAFVLAILIDQIGGGVNTGVIVGAIAGVGIFAMGDAPHAAFVGRPPMLYLIDAGQSSTSMIAMGAIIGTWEHL